MMHLPLLFILILSAAYTSFAIPPPVCETGEPVCCSGDLIADQEGILLECDPCKQLISFLVGQIEFFSLPFLNSRLILIRLA